MTKRKKILTGIFALVIGLSVAVPMRASADEYNHHNTEYSHHNNAHHWNRWRWDHYQDHTRGYPEAPRYAYGQRGYTPANGQGMADPRNPNLFWACDSDGHHCHWAPRY